MKRLIAVLLSVMLLGTLAACSSGSGEPEKEATTEVVTEATEAVTEATTQEPISDGPVVLTINTDGMGEIAYAPEGETPEFDSEIPAQSLQAYLQEAGTYVLAAKADDGWKFSKWTKNGEDFSTDAEITVMVGNDVEYVAIFETE